MDKEECQLEASNDFEQEMNFELESRFHEAETSGGIKNSSDSISKNPRTNDWDSDEDDNYLDDWDKKEKTDEEQEKINDELFYDPDMDDEDQKWADDFRRQCSLSTSGPHLKTDNYMLPMDLKVESSDQGVVGQMLNNGM